MDMINLVLRETTASLKKYGREAFLPVAGRRSRAIIPGDDPGDQQPPERGGFYPDTHAIAASPAAAVPDRSRTDCALDRGLIAHVGPVGEGAPPPRRSPAPRFRRASVSK
jgi:hypothetical protein